MIFERVHVRTPRLLPGCSAGLDEKTAVCELQFVMVPGGHWATAEPAIRRHLQTFAPADGLDADGLQRWPGCYFREPDAAALSKEMVRDPVAPLALWVVALTIALQQWARDPVWRGRVLACEGNRVRLAIPWQREGVFKGALSWALRLLGAWSAGDKATHARLAAEDQVRAWQVQAQNGGLAPNSLRFAQAAAARGMPCAVMPGFVQLGWGSQAERLDSSFTGHTGNLAARLARSKFMASQLLAQAGLPVPACVAVADQAQATQAAHSLGWPVVVKPSNQDQGTAVVPGIKDETALRAAFEQAAKYSPGAVLIEKHVEGDDHRLLVVQGDLLMATQRIPGGVVGDGASTVRQLVEQVNADPRRGKGKRSLLLQLALDDEAKGCLTEQDLSADAVPVAGQFVRLRRTANISTGGTPRDVTPIIHPDNRHLAVRAARVIGLDIAGVDFLCPDITRSWREVGGAICEVNAQPGFRVHWLGDPARDINAEVLARLYPGGNLRIPTAAITGTNGKTTTARMLHHIWLNVGKVAGVCTTNGVWVGHDQVSDKNLSGFPGARMLFNDPAVEVAVIELPRKGLLQFGHPCDRYDVAALLNVQDDHIGVDGIKTLQDMACLKAEVLERASKAIVINAEDPLCLAARARAGTQRHILVGRSAAVPAIEAHRAEGGQAVFVQTHEGRPIVLATGAAQTPLMPLHDIPATMGGLLKFNESNALFAVALGWAQGVPLDTMRQAMASFHNSPEHNPGRYNWIDGLPFQVLLDYGHNPDGVAELCAIAQQLPIPGQRILMNQKLGNRHRAHFVQMAQQLGQTFDRFVLGCDPEYVRHCPDYAGEDPVANMLKTGQQCLLDAGVAADRMADVADPREAIRQALAMAQAGDLLVLLAEPWVALPLIEQWRSTAGLTVKHG